MSRTIGRGLLEVTFMTNFPKKVSGDEEYETSLKNLVLMPSSAVLMMTKWKNMIIEPTKRCWRWL